MMFYGTLSLGFSIYIIITILLDIGSGYNEYNKLKTLLKSLEKDSQVKIVKFF
jgi:hypothetical protein